MDILNGILIGFIEVKTALTADLGVWWVLAPLVALWILMEIYFGEYKQERLGFSIFLLFYFLKKRLGVRGDVEWVRLAGHEEEQ